MVGGAPGGKRDGGPRGQPGGPRGTREHGVLRKDAAIGQGARRADTPSGGRPQGLEAWAGLCELVDAVRILVNRQLQADVGLTLADNLVLCQVAMAPERRLRMVDIAARLDIAKSAVTKTVDRLEQRGLLVRQSDPADRRTVYAALTDLGLETFAAAQPAYVRAVDRHFAGLLEPSELRNLRRATSAVLTGLRRASAH